MIRIFSGFQATVDDEYQYLNFFPWHSCITSPEVKTDALSLFQTESLLGLSKYDGRICFCPKICIKRTDLHALSIAKLKRIQFSKKKSH